LNLSGFLLRNRRTCATPRWSSANSTASMDSTLRACHKTTETVRA
jgi:hypothetical protein